VICVLFTLIQSYDSLLRRAGQLVKQSPPNNISDPNDLLRYFAEADLSEVYNHFFALYGPADFSAPRAMRAYRYMVFMLHVSLMRHCQGAELIPDLSILAYFCSPGCLAIMQRLGGVLSLPTVLQRISDMRELRPFNVAHRLARLMEHGESIIFLMDDFQRTMRSSVRLRREMSAGVSDFSNATKLFGIGRPNTDCRVSIRSDVPLLRSDFNSNLARLQLYASKIDFNTWTQVVRLEDRSDRFRGGRSTQNFRLLNLKSSPLKSLDDVISALLEFDLALTEASKLTTNAAPRPAMFFCADFPLFKSYAQLALLLRPHLPWASILSELRVIYPQSILRDDMLKKLEQMHTFMANVIPLPAQFHAQQSALKGLYCAGFRLIFRPIAQAITGKDALTADLPYAVVERQFSIINMVSRSEVWLDDTSFCSDEPWVHVARHFMHVLIPMSLDLQDMFRAAPLPTLQNYLIRMIVLFAEIGKLHYRSCFVYLLNQLEHFKLEQPSIFNYLSRKFSDLNEVAIEYYHAQLCSFTQPGMTPAEVEMRAEVMDEIRDTVADANRFLYGSRQLRYRERAKVSPSDPLVQRDMECVSSVFRDILVLVKANVPHSGRRAFIAEVMLSQKGELYYRSPAFGLVECRSLGMQYSPQCVLSCSSCLRQQACRVCSCHAPLCSRCRHRPANCPKAKWSPAFAEMLHTCWACSTVLPRPDVVAALQVGARGLVVGSNCAHILCGSCAGGIDAESCMRCRTLINECLSDATDRAAQLFTLSPVSSFRKTLASLLVSNAPHAEAGLQAGSGVVEESVDNEVAGEGEGEGEGEGNDPTVDCSFESSVSLRESDLGSMCLMETPETSQPAPASSTSNDRVLEMMNLSGSALHKVQAMRKSQFPPVNNPGNLVQQWYKRKDMQ
jgi:hypothetical protein